MAGVVSMVEGKSSDGQVENNNQSAEEIKEQQVNLLGSARLYQRVHMNLLQHKFEPFFASEQFKLYAWRLEFFNCKIGNYGELSSKKAKNIFIFQDVPMYTVPYQITKKFHTFAWELSQSLNLYNLSRKATIKFDKDFMHYNFMDKDKLEENGMSFSDCAHIIAAIHRVGPCSLLETAMKAVLLHDLPLKEIPKELQKKAKEGLYSLEDPVPNNLSLAGQNLFMKFRNNWIESKEKETEESQEEENEDTEESQEEENEDSEEEGIDFVEESQELVWILNPKLFIYKLIV